MSHRNRDQYSPVEQLAATVNGILHAFGAGYLLAILFGVVAFFGTASLDGLRLMPEWFRGSGYTVAQVLEIGGIILGALGIMLNGTIGAVTIPMLCAVAITMFLAVIQLGFGGWLSESVPMPVLYGDCVGVISLLFAAIGFLSGCAAIFAGLIQPRDGLRRKS